MFCRQLALLNRTDNTITAKPLLCKCWTCSHCQDILRRRVIRRAITGTPTTMLTLTSNPKAHPTPDDAANELKDALAALIRKLRKRHPKQTIQYMAVFEQTKQGWPHLHVLLRAPFIPQHWISKFMDARIRAPIVDVRAVRSARDVARYIGKYLTKHPRKWPGCQRYWTSREWRTHDDDHEQDPSTAGKWHVWPHRVGMLEFLLSRAGWNIEPDNDPNRPGSFTAWKDPTDDWYRQAPMLPV